MDAKKILVIGSGGREHAMCRKLSLSPKVSKVFFAPGNAASDTKIEVIEIDPSNHKLVIEFIKANDIYFTVVGPEAPLADGIIDSLQNASIPCFGPTRAAARLESSKTYAKEIMKKAGVPTAGSEYFTEEASALKYLSTVGAPVVIKADGLAAGKGVTVALDSATAEQAVIDCFSGNLFGDAGSQVLIEDFLEGKEASVMAVINEGHICMLPVSSDYKRALNDDLGPNTGGMGTVSPTPVFSETRLEEVKAAVFEPVISQLKKEGIDFKGFLYAGLMVGHDGCFKVLEFNCRLGDPETQSLLLRIEDDFFEMLEKAIFAPQSLPATASLSKKFALTVVLASKGYPGVVDDGKLISGLECEYAQGVNIFHAGTKLRDGKVYSKGGRVLGVSALGDDVNSARESVYSALKLINFEGLQFRSDIGNFKGLS